MAEVEIGWCGANEEYVIAPDFHEASNHARQWSRLVVVELELMGLRPELGSEARIASTC